MASLNNLGVTLFNAAGKAYLNNRQEQREDDGYKKDMARKNEQLRQASDMRLQEDEKRVSTEQLRKQSLVNQKIAEVRQMFPDRWDKEPGFKEKVTAGLNGIVIPAEPANKEIGRLFADGKFEDALRLASQSNNPADIQFLNDTVSARKSYKAFQELLNPRQTISSGGYLHTYNPNDPLNTLQSKALPTRTTAGGSGESGGSGSFSSGLRQSLLMKEKQIKNVMDSFTQIQGELQDWSTQRSEEDEKALQSALRQESSRLSRLRREYDQLLSSNGQAGIVAENQGAAGTRGLSGKRSPAYNAIMQGFIDVYDRAAQSLQPAQNGSSRASVNPVSQGFMPGPMVPPIASGSASIPIQNAQPKPAPVRKNVLSELEALKQQKFGTLVTAISKQLNRYLSDDERGFIATGVYNGWLDNLVFDFERGTYTKPGAASEEPLSDLITSKMGEFTAENLFQAIPDARSKATNLLSRLLQGTVLTEEGAKALRNL